MDVLIFHNDRSNNFHNDRSNSSPVLAVGNSEAMCQSRHVYILRDQLYGFVPSLKNGKMVPINLCTREPVDLDVFELQGSSTHN